LNYASAAIGTSTHLAAELFQSMAHVKFQRIGYKGGGAALNEVVAGQVHLIFAVAASAGPQIKSGRLRALGVTSLKTLELLPGVPTIAASGLPGYESSSLGALFAPAKTPEAVIARLNQETVRAVNAPEAKRRFADAGIEIVGSTPDQLSAMLRAEIQKWGKVIKEAGIHEE
jgi:tripartite-type tricarboxylate transporter receptor subunit TctC